MRLEKLNGWQRLWVLASLIYLVAVVFVAIIDFPTPWKSYISDEEITKKLSIKTLQLIAKTDDWIEVPVNQKGDIFGKEVTAEQLQPITIQFPNGKKLLVSTGTKQADLDYINKDYCNAVISLTNKERIHFIVTILLAWIVPCIAVYMLGVSVNWVYRGFKQKP